MADKIIRPDFSSVKTEYKELGFYLKELQKIAMSEGNAKSQARQKITPAIDRSFFETLKSVSVDELNTVGHNIRVSALKNAGVDNLYDLSKLSQSKLDSIPGIGPKRKKLLLNKFKSVKRIKEATVEELRSVKGIDFHTAETIFQYFKNL